MKEFDREKIISCTTLGTETILNAINILSGEPITAGMALLPAVVEKILVEKEIVKTNISDRLQLQLSEVIEKTIEKCKEELDTVYLGKKFEKLIETYEIKLQFKDDFDVNLIHELKSTILGEVKEENLYLTPKELNEIWNIFMKNFNFVMVGYSELTNYVILGEVQKINMKIDELDGERELNYVPRVLTKRASLPPKEFYGRQHELDDIINKMKTSTKLLLVNGMGGVGKSALARKLYHYFLKQTNKFLIWINYGGHDLFNDFIEQMIYPDGGKKEVENFLYNELDANTIIFIDNLDVTEAEDEYICMLKTLECYVICTSRVRNIESFCNINIDLFDEEQSIELFAAYYKKEYNYELIREIVKRAKYHTLVIEVIAKIGVSEELSLKEILGELEKKGFNLSGIAEVNLNEKTLVGHLCKLFSTKRLSKKQKYILENMSALGLSNIPIEFTRWIDLQNRHDLNYLENHAWINKTKTGFYMHPLIMEVVKQLCSIAYTNTECLVRNLANAIKYDSKKNSYENLYLLPYAENLAKRYGKIHKKDVVNLLYNISIIYYLCDENEKAEIYIKQTIRNANSIEKFPKDELAEYINHYAVICHNRKEYNRSTRIYKRALKMKREHSTKKEIAQTLSNIALDYQLLYENDGNQDWLNESYKNQKESNAIYEKIFKDNGYMHPEMASAYNNTGRLHYIQGQYSEAINFFNRALYIRKKVLDVMNGDLGITYNFLGDVYYDYGCTKQNKAERNELWDMALDSYQRCLEIRIFNYEKGIRKYKPEEVREKIKYISELMQKNMA